MLAYRSRALVRPSERELEGILRKAQERNRAERLSGLLIYDQGCFFQWLEGPAAALARVWQSIQRDSRHRDIEILREQNLTDRFFGAWDMRLARRPRGRLETALQTLETPEDLLERVQLRASGLDRGAWDDIFADIVIPLVKARHGLPAVRGMPSRPAAWHAEDGAAERLAGLLLAVENGAVAEFVDSLAARGASLESLYAEVFEPAARCLGGLQDADEASAFAVDVGMGRLQCEARRASRLWPHALHTIRPDHAVLVATPPGERHGAGAAMSSELFWRDGWDVSCEYPDTDVALGRSVHERWFDVLDLSFSGALRTEQRCAATALTIRAVHAASLNPGLAVIVDGRSFFERPAAHRDVGADAACATVIELVAVARRLLDAEIARRADGARRRRADCSRAVRPAAQGSAAAAASLRLFERRFKSTVF
jgi:hypothetical protein